MRFHETRTFCIFPKMSIRFLSLNIGLLTCILCHSVSRAQNTNGVRDHGNIRCQPRRQEVVFPLVTDTVGHTTSEIFSQSSPQDVLTVTVRWRQQDVPIVLDKNNISTPTSVIEWMEGNVTTVEVLDKFCTYQGHVRNQYFSYVAVSTCGGLAGYIQTDDEILFIQPDQSDSNNNAHLIFTCESKSHFMLENPDLAGDTMTRRLRRSIKPVKYVEIQITVDHTVVKSQGSKSKATDYVMTLVNIANTVYQHNSLDQNIRIAVIKIVFISRYQQRDVFRLRNPGETIKQYCKWSYKQRNRKNFDVTMLLTEADFGHSGFAPVETMCKENRNCFAVQDQGFTSGFIIAHELGHVFGLNHDGQENSCRGSRYKKTIMSSIVVSSLNHYWWSECSKRSMVKLMRSISCLDNIPTTVDNHFTLTASQKMDEDLGISWSLDYQCRRIFDSNYEFCKAMRNPSIIFSISGGNNDPCKQLLCNKKNDPLMCFTRYSIPLPGTNCGTNKKCIDMTCVEASTDSGINVETGTNVDTDSIVETEIQVNGTWGEWTSWTTCNSGCGVGIKKRTRTCQFPPKVNRGLDCEGDEKAWTACADYTCHNKNKDMRAEECSKWPRSQIASKWLPFENHNVSMKCQQNCQAFPSGKLYVNNENVADGTPCSYMQKTGDICVNGKCIKVGCDGETGSGKEIDACGICDGNGSLCKTLKGVFNKTSTSVRRYMKVLRIPAGARQITVSKNSDRNSFLALKDGRTGRYLLNRDRKYTLYATVVHTGALFLYTHGNSTHMEVFITYGPLVNPLDVLIYVSRRGETLSISYTFTVNKDDETFEKNKFKWKFESWSPCSVTCGTGAKKTVYGCYDKDSNGKVNDSLCSVLTPPRIDSSKCSKPRCPMTSISYQWNPTEDWTQCNVECDKTGIQSRIYQCQKKEDNKIIADVEDSFCNNVQKPDETKQCSGPTCTSERETGNWSKKVGCDGKAGSGKEIDACGICDGNGSLCKTIEGVFNKASPSVRRYMKVLRIPAGARQITVSKNSSPNSFLALKDGRTGRYFLNGNRKFAPYTQVSHTSALFLYTHGNSTHMEMFITSGPTVNPLDVMIYVSRRGETLSISYNFTVNKDDETFEKNKFKWKFETWSLCSVTCGTGTKKTVYGCYDRDSNGKVDDRLCSVLTPPRIDSSRCSKPRCPVKSISYQWNPTENWTQCNVECDKTGNQSRIYHCQKKEGSKIIADVEDSFCNNVQNPDETKQCNGPPCIGNWSEKVGCDGVTGSGKEIDVCGICNGNGSLCKTIEGVFNKASPSVRRYMKILRIPAGARQITVSKSSDPNSFLALKDVRTGRYFMNGDRKFASYDQIVHTGALFLYTHGNSTQMEMFTTSGPLVNPLDVMIYVSSRGETLSISYTFTVNKDDETFEKNKFKWNFESWSPCSVTCGSGTKKTVYGCYDKDSNGKVNDSLCSVLTPPNIESSICSEPRCPAESISYQWNPTENWTQCNAECDEIGNQSRIYHCQKKESNKIIADVEDSFCNNVQKLEETKQCNGSPCTIQRETGNWSQKVGCDAETYSGKEIDVCGICDGNGSLCKTIEGVFNKASPSVRRYMKVLRIPAGARQITVTKNSDPNSFLALKDGHTGRYFMNGDRNFAAYDQIVHTDALFLYTHGNSTQMEMFSTSGPLVNPLDVMIYVNRRGETLSISYTFTVPKDDETFEKNKFKWKFESWSPCSVTCGSGTKKTVYGCYDKDSNGKVNDSLCSVLTPPNIESSRCSEPRCPAESISYQWNPTENWTQCSAECDEIGNQSRIYHCQKKEGNRITDDVEDSFCNNLQKLDETKQCNGPPCTIQRETGNWSEKVGCDGETGSGKEIDVCGICGGNGSLCRTIEGVFNKASPSVRRYMKVLRIPAGARQITVSKNSDPNSFLALKDGRTGSYLLNRHRKYAPHAQVVHTDALFLYTHGNSTQMEMFSTSGPLVNPLDVMIYVSRRGETLSISYTFTVNKDDETFEKNKFKWKFESWSPCSVTCGIGAKKTVYGCYDKDSNGKVNDSLCSVLTPPRIDSSKCAKPRCPVISISYQWNPTKNWTQCNVECDKTEIQSRIYHCQKKEGNKIIADVEDSFCNNVQKPDETKQCNGPPCTFQWETGNWSECSVTCGRGKQYRDVYCGDPETDEDDMKCTDAPPSTSKRCDLPLCTGSIESDCKDKYTFCVLYTRLNQRCRSKSFRQMCCKTCNNLELGDKH